MGFHHFLLHQHHLHISPVVRNVRRWEFEMYGTVVQHEANQDNLACLLWLKMQTTVEAMPPQFCHTNASLHSCTCRTVGKIVSPLWPSCWTLYRCHEPGSNHISICQGVHPGEARFLQRQQTGQILKILA